MTQVTHQQVLWATGLAFCAGPGLRVNPAAATHRVGLGDGADHPETADAFPVPVAGRLIGRPRAGSD